VPTRCKRWLTKPLCVRLAQRLFFCKKGEKLTKGQEDFTIDALSRLGANSIAQSLRERYRGYKFFKADVFMFPYGKAGNFCYVVRTNLVNGLPPTKPTPIKPPDAAFLRKSAPNVSQVAA
jgi:hypothetical protein